MFCPSMVCALTSAVDENATNARHHFPLRKTVIIFPPKKRTPMKVKRRKSALKYNSRLVFHQAEIDLYQSAIARKPSSRKIFTVPHHVAVSGCMEITYGRPKSFRRILSLSMSAEPVPARGFSG